MLRFNCLLNSPLQRHCSIRVLSWFFLSSRTISGATGTIQDGRQETGIPRRWTFDKGPDPALLEEMNRLRILELEWMVGRHDEPRLEPFPLVSSSAATNELKIVSLITSHLHDRRCGPKTIQRLPVQCSKTPRLIGVGSLCDRTLCNDSSPGPGKRDPVDGSHHRVRTGFASPYPSRTAANGSFRSGS